MTDKFVLLSKDRNKMVPRKYRLENLTFLFQKIPEEIIKLIAYELLGGWKTLTFKRQFEVTSSKSGLAEPLSSLSSIGNLRGPW